MEKFSEIYDNMNKTYNELEGIMGSLYEKENKEEFVQITSIAKGMLLSQMEFVNAYCPNDMKETLISNIESKEATLSKALDDALNKAL